MLHAYQMSEVQLVAFEESRSLVISYYSKKSSSNLCSTPRQFCSISLRMDNQQNIRPKSAKEAETSRIEKMRARKDEQIWHFFLRQWEAFFGPNSGARCPIKRVFRGTGKKGTFGLKLAIFPNFSPAVLGICEK